MSSSRLPVTMPINGMIFPSFSLCFVFPVVLKLNMVQHTGRLVLAHSPLPQPPAAPVSRVVVVLFGGFCNTIVVWLV